MSEQRCAICAIPLTRFAAMCEVNDAAYCEKHWSGVGCHKLHGEFCATFVWNDDLHCGVPGCTNATATGICDECDLWVSDQVASLAGQS